MSSPMPSFAVAAEKSLYANWTAHACATITIASKDSIGRLCDYFWTARYAMMAARWSAAGTPIIILVPGILAAGRAR